MRFKPTPRNLALLLPAIAATLYGGYRLSAHPAHNEPLIASRAAEQSSCRRADALAHRQEHHLRWPPCRYGATARRQVAGRNAADRRQATRHGQRAVYRRYAAGRAQLRRHRLVPRWQHALRHRQNQQKGGGANAGSSVVSSPVSMPQDIQRASPSLSSWSRTSIQTGTRRMPYPPGSPSLLTVTDSTSRSSITAPWLPSI